MDATRSPHLADRIRRRLKDRRVLRMDPDQLASVQLAALNRVLDSAVRTAPYRSGYHRVERIEELRSFPIVDRAYLMSFDMAERIATPRGDLQPQPSTGTTGEPMVTMRSPEENLLQGMFYGRHRRGAGINPRSRQLHIDGTLPPDAAVVVRGNRAQAPGGASVDLHAEVIRTFRPAVVTSAPSILLELADHMKAKVRVELITTYGEVLSATDRDELRRSYGAEAIDLYNTSEVGAVAWQCRARGSYHVNADNVIIEVLDDGNDPVPPGQSGHLVLTALGRTTTPVIRYRIGDIGRLLPGACGCGLVLPMMGQPEGRVVDCLIAHDGRRISPMRFALVHVGPYHDRVRRWRLTQRGIGDLLVEMVFRGEPIAGIEYEMSAAWSQLLRGPVSVEVRPVDRIVTPPGAKFRWVQRTIA